MAYFIQGIFKALSELSFFKRFKPPVSSYMASRMLPSLTTTGIKCLRVRERHRLNTTKRSPISDRTHCSLHYWDEIVFFLNRIPLDFQSNAMKRNKAVKIFKSKQYKFYIIGTFNYAVLLGSLGYLKMYLFSYVVSWCQWLNCRIENVLVAKSYFRFCY